LSIVDLQMLVGRDGQLYVIDPANSDSPLTEPLYFMRDDLQKFRTKSIRDYHEYAQLKYHGALDQLRQR
jgi:tRNA(Leu) C34 or U34 (ribose-2'-O)-methylase TrmL